MYQKLIGIVNLFTKLKSNLVGRKKKEGKSDLFAIFKLILE